VRSLYTLCYFLLLPFIFLRLYIRGKKAPAYRQRWGERVARFAAPDQTRGIWIHAVSVGEVLAAIPLIKHIQKKLPTTAITVTCMTPTGSERIRASLGESVFHVYVPYDLPFLINRFLQKVKPQILVLMETELWPNILHTCKHKAIPILLANARLSLRSYQRYYRIQNFIQPLLQNLTLVAAQSVNDAKFFAALGIDSHRIQICGNLKFDVTIPSDAATVAQQLRSQWGEERPVWIAASTHEGEDEIVLQAFANIKQEIPNILLILVPRHPERFQKVTRLCTNQGYRVVQRSTAIIENSGFDIYLGDTMGELLKLFAAADVAFIGGSFIPVGGHNLLEPALFKKPSITGPHVFNFSLIYDELSQAGGCIMVNNATTLAATVCRWLNNPESRLQAGEQAYQVIAQNRGAIEKQMHLLENLLTLNFDM
jgi:3-deoxy-D-manno-octulosonic-acid transferase